MGPARLFDVGDVKYGQFAIGARRGSDQRHDAVFKTHEQLAVGGGDRGGARAWSTVMPPRDLAGHEVDANGRACFVAVPRINMVADQDHAAVMVLKNSAFEEVHFASLDLRTRPFKL